MWKVKLKLVVLGADQEMKGVDLVQKHQLSLDLNWFHQNPKTLTGIHQHPSLSFMNLSMDVDEFKLESSDSDGTNSDQEIVDASVQDQLPSSLDPPS